MVKYSRSKLPSHSIWKKKGGYNLFEKLPFIEKHETLSKVHVYNFQKCLYKTITDHKTLPRYLVRFMLTLLFVVCFLGQSVVICVSFIWLILHQQLCNDNKKKLESQLFTTLHFQNLVIKSSCLSEKGFQAKLDIDISYMYGSKIKLKETFPPKSSSERKKKKYKIQSNLLFKASIIPNIHLMEISTLVDVQFQILSMIKEIT